MADVSTVTDGFFVTAQEGFTTTTSGSVAEAAVTVGLNSVTGYANGDHVTLVIDPTDATKKQVFTGTIDTAGVQITDVVWTEGDNQAHSAGATVVDYETATAWALQKKGWDTEHNQDGTHSDVTADTLSLAGNLDVVDGAAIRDGNDNELVIFQQTASAVNQLDITNAATGNAPSISATGGDTNIPLNLVTKGTGLFQFNGAYKDPLEIKRTTLTSAGDTITVSSIPARRFLQVVVVGLATGGTLDATIRFNGDSGANYAWRFSNNHGADTNSVSQTSWALLGATVPTGQIVTGVLEIVNIATYPKTINSRIINSSTAGAGTGVSLMDIEGKWVNTSDQISSIVWTNAGTGDFAIGSEVIVYGWD